MEIVFLYFRRRKRWNQKGDNKLWKESYWLKSKTTKLKHIGLIYHIHYSGVKLLNLLCLGDHKHKSSNKIIILI